MIGVIFFKELADAKLIVVDKDEHIADLSFIPNLDQPEDGSITFDTSYLNNSQKLPQALPWWVIENEKLDEKMNLSSSPYRGNGQVEVLIADPDGRFYEYDCERFFNFEGTKYFVQEGRYLRFNDASRRMQELINRGFLANVFWLGCHAEPEHDYVIFFNELYHTEANAMQQLSLIKDNAMNNELEMNNLRIVSFDFTTQ